MTGARQLTAPAIRGPELELLRVELAAAGLGPDQVDGGGRDRVVRAGRGCADRPGRDREVPHRRRAGPGVGASGSGGRVLGLATTEIATRNLAEDGVAAMNTARFLALYGPGPDGAAAAAAGRARGPVRGRRGRHVGAPRNWPRSRHRRRGGGKIVYTGDHGQLTSIGAGGMLALLAARQRGATSWPRCTASHHDWEKAGVAAAARRGHHA